MSQTMTIPQHTLDHYNVHYNNQTYRAFSIALTAALGLDERVVRLEAHDDNHNRIMNLLIDASMELVGSEYRAGAGQRLGEALGALDDHTPTLVKLAAAHLDNFAAGDCPWKAWEKIAHMATLALAESARRALVRALDHAALLQGWRGTTAYYWLLACTQIIRSAEIVLQGDPDADYLGLQDIGRAMPDFEEIPVPIPMDPDMALHYHRAKDRLGIYLFQCWMEGDASFLGKYLQTLLSWPTAPFRAEKIIHKRRLDRESDVFLEIPVHDMLQNKTYTGRVCHSETLYNGTLGQGKKSSRHRKTWYEGKHQGFITDELFKVCQQVREGMVSHRMPTNRRRTYVLHHRVFCARCLVAMPRGLQDDNYGKMRPAWDRRRGTGYYRCLCKERGYEDCGQLSIREDDLNEQVVAVLSGLVIPEDFCERVESAVRSRVENEASLQRMAEIREIIERIDFRWNYGFIDWDEYFKKRAQLEREIESLRSIDYDELHEAADLIRNFRSYWEQCAETDEPDEARQQLLAKIVEQVIVYDNHVVAIALHGDFNVILDDEGSMPVEIADVLGEKITARHSEMTRGRCGSDGLGTLGGYVIFGRKTDYRRCVETIFSFKQAA